MKHCISRIFYISIILHHKELYLSAVYTSSFWLQRNLCRAILCSPTIHMFGRTPVPCLPCNVSTHRTAVPWPEPNFPRPIVAHSGSCRPEVRPVPSSDGGFSPRHFRFRLVPSTLCRDTFCFHPKADTVVVYRITDIYAYIYTYMRDLGAYHPQNTKMTFYHTIGTGM